MAPLTPADVAERAELHAAVLAAFSFLTPRVREVAELRWGGRLSYREIAELLGISERTVNTQLTVASRLLRERLGMYWSGR